MADAPLPSVRSEIQDYLRCGERLLSAALTADHVPFSSEEGIVEYYAVELLKLIPRVRARPVQKYRQSIHEYVRLSEALLKIDDFTPTKKN
jgi:hypothetical protein